MKKPNAPNVNFSQHGPRAQATHAHAPAQPCRSCHAPKSATPRTNAVVRYGFATGYQILVPHCQSCSQAQSKAAAEFVRQSKALGKNLDWSTWNNTQERESFF